jgi:hypothetical protein
MGNKTSSSSTTDVLAAASSSDCQFLSLLLVLFNLNFCCKKLCKPLQTTTTNSIAKL